MVKNWLRDQKAKAILLQVFKSGELGIEYAYGKNKGMIYPKVRKVKFDQEKKTVTYYFSLPHGLDPKELKKKRYCFEQTFGQKIEIKGEVKEYKLTVFLSVLPPEFKYNYEAYKPDIKNMKLPIVAGFDLNGGLIVFDMVEFPHLLISGETGSGKSTQLRSVLTTLIQAVPPERLNLYLCDLKLSEFHIFKQIEHVEGVYVTPGEIRPMLTKIRNELTKRSRLLEHHEVAHIDDVPGNYPYIILSIDEFALLKKERDIWESIEVVSSIGRALGVFLILSILRPDRNSIEGAIKSNLTVRMGLRCQDLINARIIGTPGSEKLKKDGSMLLKIPMFQELKEIQGPYLKLAHAKKILEGYKCPKKRKANMTPSSDSDNVLQTTETQENIFEVLKDE